MRRAQAALALAVALAALVAGCGGGEEERTLTPREFIREMNANGAALKLGPVLTQSADGVDVNEVTIAKTAPTPTGEGSRPAASGSATLLALPDADAARDEYERCQAGTLLSCYRAANIVLRIESLQPTDRAALTAAISALASDGD
jgi:hypothetical protein